MRPKNHLEESPKPRLSLPLPGYYHRPWAPCLPIIGPKCSQWQFQEPGEVTCKDRGAGTSCHRVRGVSCERSATPHPRDVPFNPWDHTVL